MLATRPEAVRFFSQYLEDCSGCAACARTFSLESYKRAGAMLGKAALPAKKRPDAADALVVVTAALHGPAQILTSDPDDMLAYAGTLNHADIVIERI
jgi:predicted nucleic acid-binding protein